jgi:hypothetical protein
MLTAIIVGVATPPPELSPGTLGAIMVGLLALYLVSCLIWPWTACSRCKGAGRFRSMGGRNWRNCGGCEGRARRLRFGAWLLQRARSRGD